MCGRFTLARSGRAIAQAFHLKEVPELEPRYNIAPTQPIPAIRQHPDVADREFTYFYWGLIPSWSKDPSMGVKMINARSETVTEKPSFRNAFKKRRCLIVADGFYEWKQVNKKKQPYFFYVGNSAEERQSFAFAGLWEHWESPEGDWINSCTILTTEANNTLRPIHDRMPVILHEENYDIWLNPQLQQPEQLLPLLRPFPAEQMGSYSVSTAVNNARNDSPEFIKPQEE